MSHIPDAFALVFAPDVMAVIMLAAVFGLFVGATPGLTATMATALLVPVTFFMPPIAAIAAIVTCAAMAIFAGDIPAALLRIPGTPASAAYAEDTYRLARNGQLGLALGTNLIASAIGGLFGTAVLILAAPRLADWALAFSSYEYFWLALLGLSCATLVSAGSAAKGIASLMLGLLLSTVGLDVISGLPRFTFDRTDLMGGVSLIAVLIGAFAVAELMRKATEIGLGAVPQARQGIERRLFREQLRVLWRHRLNVLRGAATGTVIGSLPGAGADIAAWVSYANAKRFSRTPEKFGTGHLEGIAEASSANNASLSGAYVPALVFGIPGDAITAIVVGVLVIKGITPGPQVFTASGELIWGVYIVFILANILMIPLGLATIRLGRRILRMPPGLLYPVILLFCAIGAFATNNALFDIWVILVIGIVVWLMEANGYPAAPMVLGLVLGRILEEAFVNSMIKSGDDLTAFFHRPLAAALGAVTLLVWSAPLLRWAWRRLAVAG